MENKSFTQTSKDTQTTSNDRSIDRYYLLTMDVQTGDLGVLLKGEGIVPLHKKLSEHFDINSNSGTSATENVAYMRNANDLGTLISKLHVAGAIDINKFELFAVPADMDLQSVPNVLKALKEPGQTQQERTSLLHSNTDLITLSNPIERHFYFLPEDSQQNVLSYYYSVSENTSTYKITFDGKFHLPVDSKAREALFSAIKQGNHLNSPIFKGVSNGAETPGSQSRSIALNLAKELIVDPARVFIAEVGDVRGMAPTKRPGEKKKKDASKGVRLNQSNS